MTIGDHPRAAHFKEVRLQHLNELAEDYTELIADLIAQRGMARVCDIARVMGVSHVSVLKTIRRLTRDGFVTKNEPQSIELTEKGRELAVLSKKKHRILSQFLVAIGVPENIAAIDVEGIEHHISSTTLQAIESLLNTLNPKPVMSSFH